MVRVTFHAMSYNLRPTVFHEHELHLISDLFGIVSKSFGVSPEEPDTPPSPLESAQHRSQDHRPSFFRSKTAHAPKCFACPIDQQANQS